MSKKAKVAVIGITGMSAFLEVDKFHTGGETVVARSCHQEFGGKGFNQAIAAARWGAEVFYLTAVGRADAASVRAVLAAEGIAGDVAEKDGDSAYAAICTNPEGETRVTVFTGSAALTRDDVAGFGEKIAGADILLLNNEVPEEVNDAAAEIAARHGVRIVMNPAPARAPTATLRKTVAIYTPNAFELEALGDVSAYPAAPEIVSTLGGEGCRIASTGETIPAASFGRPVDTTGAGDTFSGVFATALAEGMSVRDAAAEGNRAAGMSVCRKYAMSSIPRR